MFQRLVVLSARFDIHHSIIRVSHAENSDSSGDLDRPQM